VMESLLPEFSRFRHVREPSGGSLPGIAPSNTYRCKDGSYVVIAGNSDGIFKRLMHAIGRPDLAEEPSLARNDGRARQERMLDQAIEAWTLQHDAGQVLAALGEADVPGGRIYTAEDIFDDVHYRARGMIEPASLPDQQPIDLPGIVPKLNDTPGETRWIGPPLGQHVEEVLAEIGITGEALAQLRAGGIV